MTQIERFQKAAKIITQNIYDPEVKSNIIEDKNYTLIFQSSGTIRCFINSKRITIFNNNPLSIRSLIKKLKSEVINVEYLLITMETLMIKLL